MRTLLPVTALTFAVLLLSGCLPRQSPVAPVPLPSATPIFATDEAALAAAEAAYREYVALADQIFAEGGTRPERLAAVASGAFLAASIDGYNQVRAQGLHSTGGTVFRNLRLQGYFPEGGTVGILTVYVCEDVSKVDVLNSQGVSVVSPNRPATTLFQGVFDIGVDGRTLRLSGREAWSNEPC